MKLKKLLILIFTLLFLVPTMVFASDTVINLNYDNGAKIEALDTSMFDIPNFNPGDVYSRNVVFNNTSNQPISVILKMIQTSDTPDVLSNIKLKIAYNGTILFYDDFTKIHDILIGRIAPNSSDTYVFSFELKAEADNSIQGIKLNEKLIFVPQATTPTGSLAITAGTGKEISTLDALLLNIMNSAATGAYSKNVTFTDNTDGALNIFLAGVDPSNYPDILSNIKLKIVHNGTVIFYDNFTKINNILLGPLDPNSSDTYVFTFELNSVLYNLLNGMSLNEKLVFATQTIAVGKNNNTINNNNTVNSNAANNNNAANIDNPATVDNGGITITVGTETGYETEVAGKMDQAVQNMTTCTCNCHCWIYDIVIIVLLLVIIGILLKNRYDFKKFGSNNKSNIEE